MKYVNEIRVDINGNCSVFGEAAHFLWQYGKGDFRRTKSGCQGFFVYGPRFLNGRDSYCFLAGQSTRELALQYVENQDCVLVCCDAEDTPVVSLQPEGIGQAYARKRKQHSCSVPPETS